jgi:uncharacterized protein YdaU (DUF1376 family)
MQTWFKFFTDEFLADEALVSLTLEERGALVTLWAHAWREGSLPSEDWKVARLLGIPGPVQATLKPALKPFFTVDPGRPDRMISPRLERERLEAENRRMALSGSGARGGHTTQARRQKGNDTFEQGPGRSWGQGPCPSGPLPVPEGPNPGGVSVPGSPKGRHEAPAGPLVPAPAKPRKVAPLKPKGGGPNAHLPPGLQPIFWEALKAFPPEKAPNPTSAAMAFAAAVATGQVTGDELAGCMRRYRATFLDGRATYMTTAHAWLENAGFMPFLEAERRGEAIQVARDPNRRRAHGAGLETDADLENYVMAEYVHPQGETA